MKRARIVGLGSYVPPYVLTNQELETLVDTQDEWIVTRTGIKERRIAKGESPSDMGQKAALKALERAKVDPQEIDLILVCTMTPDYLCPSTAALIQKKINAKKAAAFDIQAACTGFLYGLSVAKAYIESALYKNVLIVATEKMSAFVNYKDRNTCILFGDGAAAALVTDAGAGLSIDTLSLGADGELGELIFIKGGGSSNPITQESLEKGEQFFTMAGKEVFKHAVRRMGLAAEECLQKANLSFDEISYLVPHQANIRILEALSKNFQLPTEKIYKTIEKYGNTSASSVAIALDELIQEKTLSDGEHLLLVAFGGGLTWGSALLTKMKDI